MRQSVDDVRNEIIKAINEKKYSDACRILFDFSYEHKSNARFNLKDFLEQLPLSGYSPDVLRQLYCTSFQSSNLTVSLRLVEALAFNHPLAAAYLVSLHKDISSNDSEHYFSAFQSILCNLDIRANLMSYEAHYRKMVHLAGILLSTTNADSLWYCCEIRDSSDFPGNKSVILNFFALYNETEFFKQAIEKGISIGQQHYSTSAELVSGIKPLIPKRFKRFKEILNGSVTFISSFCEKTPLDYALQSDSQGVIKLIVAEIEKLTVRTIRELITQKRWQTLTPENKKEIEAQLEKSVYEKFLPATPKAIDLVKKIISSKMQETIDVFYPPQLPPQPAPTLIANLITQKDSVEEFCKWIDAMFIISSVKNNSAAKKQHPLDMVMQKKPDQESPAANSYAFFKAVPPYDWQMDELAALRVPNAPISAAPISAESDRVALRD